MPVGAVRIGKIDGNFVVNPTEEAMQEADMDLVVSGTDEAILMVECGANEVPEAEILDALDIAHSAIKQICAVQHELREKAGKPKQEIEVPQVDEGLFAQIQESHGSQLDEATSVQDKLARQDATKAVEAAVLEQYSGSPEDPSHAEFRQKAQLAFDKLEKGIIRQRIAVQKKRPDGRGTDEIRDIWIEAGVLPRAHGSAIFTRGQTQALSVASLGTTREEMRIDSLGLETSRRYWHHYNFPPFSVGEAGFMRGPKRRDIGHGALAERALVPMVPSAEEFPYTIRVVSDILESNGSSSMASVCGSSLALMDAGVPIKRPVAGIAMGLIKEGDDYVVLSDIAGVHQGQRGSADRGHRRGAYSPTRSPRPRSGGRTSSARWPRSSRRRAASSRSSPRGSRRSRSIRTRSACSSARAARRSAACATSSTRRSTSTTTATSSSTPRRASRATP
jgi:polyribonucleotide nucleotidyltransferase